jgi:hypothetical protein
MSFRAAVPLSLLLLACTGSIGPVDSTGGDPSHPPGSTSSKPGSKPANGAPNFGDPATSARGAPGPAFDCDAKATPPSLPLRRLTKAQYQNSIRDAVTLALGATEAAAVVNAVSGDLQSRPDDLQNRIGTLVEGKTFGRLDQVIRQEHADTGFAIAKAVAAQMVAGDRLGKLLGACATDADTANDRACLTTFLQRWGSRVQRRPLTSDDVTFYLRYTFDKSPVLADSVANVLTGVLGSPRFQYLVEHGQDSQQGPVVALTAYEMAARLSYQLWDTLPDDELWQTAVDGTLLTPSVAKQQMQRLVQDPRGRQTAQAFLHQWLNVDNLADLEELKNTPAYKTFSAGMTPTASLRAAMIAELDALVNATVLERAGSVDDLFTTTALFPRSADLAKIYGTATWDGKGPSITGTRRGVLTRAALLADADPKTHPILRGRFVRGTVLCDVIPDPPANAAQNLPSLDPAMSGREVVEAITEQPGTSCAGCHKGLINPIGYLLEGYDSLGRARQQETVIDLTTGKVVATKPLKLQATPVISADDGTPANNDSDLMDRIVTSHKVPACLARQALRFTSARKEDPQSDGCTLERTRQAFTNGSFQDGWLAVLTSPDFWQRTF